MKSVATLTKRYLGVIVLITLLMNANAQNKMVRKELLNAPIGKQAISSVKIVEVEFQAGQKGAYHQHPCPVVGYIVSGVCLLQVEGEPAQVLKAGDAFFEPAGTPIAHFDNYSDKEPMKFTAYYLLNGEMDLIEMLPPKK